ncbi:hypothetical protein MFLAVUS_000954 [Mucor flavus]|uniref:Coenzyme Q-binding protein COQ10 START domain-containing protein n=1 Tax=Mucor flavus TaxID=439312 RepID=A0ABP9YL77_9FUNG
MITAILVICLVLVPTIPLLLYGIGLLLPASHIVTRSATYNTTAEIVWAILTSVQDYPAWRSNIDRVTLRQDEFESDINKYEDESRLTFVEYTSKKDRRTVIVHIEQEHERKLLRVIEERPYITPGEEHSFTNSNFSGSWTFLIEPEQDKVTLKITEYGIVKKPMVRAFHTLFFGFNRRIDRFLKDLGKEIELGFLEEQEEIKEEQQEEEEEEKEEVKGQEQLVEEEDQAQPSLTESKLLDKEWDMVNEIYEKKEL